MRIRSAIRPYLALAAVTSAAAQEKTSVNPPASTGPEWEWTIVPYAWGPTVVLDVDVNGNPVLGGDASVQDLLDKVDLAGMLHFEARHGKAGLLADGLYISLSDESTSSGNPPLPGGTLVDTDLKVGVYELGGFYRPGGKTSGFDILFGGRYLDVHQDLDVAFPGPFGVTTSINGSEDYLDVFAGVRFSVPIGQRWDFVVRGDVAAGGTDFTWNADALFGFKFDKAGRYTLTGGYRAMHIDLGETTDRGTEVTSTISLTGPAMGFRFRF